MLRLLSKLFSIIIFLSFLGFGEDFERICDEEVLKEDFNISVIHEACLKVAQKHEKEKNFENASWYYLLGGNIDRNINIIEGKIDDGWFVNIGHSYLLKDKIDKVTPLYLTYIEQEIQPNNIMLDDFKLLSKLYPQKKVLLQKGLKKWNTLYKPLEKLDFLYNKYINEEKNQKYMKAIQTLQEIIKLRKDFSNKETQNIATDYNNLALLYSDLGEDNQALKYMLTSLNIDKKLFNKYSNQVAIDYSNIASIYEKLSQYKKSEKYHLLAIKIFKKLFNENDKSVATSYNNLAFLYSSIGKYTQSEKYYKKALYIEKEILKEDSAISTTINNLGELYSLLGDYPKAMQKYQESLKLDLKNYEKNHTVIANDYNNIAQIYEFLEDYNRSKQYYEKSLKIATERLPKVHPLLATIYSNLGNLYYIIDKDRKSFDAHKKALDIRIKLSKGEPNIDIANSYHAIGLLYSSSQDYNKSLEYFQKNLDITKQLLGSNNIINANTYNAMGFAYQMQNNPHKALKFYLRTLELENKSLGKNHINLAKTYNSLSVFYASQQEKHKAYIYSKLSCQIFQKNKNNFFTILDNQQKRKYTKKYDYSINNLLYLTNKSYKDIDFTLNFWLNYKGTLFEYQNILSMIKNNSKTPKEIVNAIDRLNLLNNKLSHIKDKEEVKKIEEKIHKVEVKLSNNNHTLKNILQLNEINTTQIVNYLQPHQLYIDFARGNDNYYIFTIDHQNNITFQQIDNNQTKLIDQTIKAYRENTQGMADEISSKKIPKEELAHYIKTSEKEAKFILSKLYNLLIKEYLQDIIKDKNHLILSPDGELNYFPFEALYHKNRYLIEKYTINYISSGKEFVRQTKLTTKHPKNEIILFANANFDAKIKEYTLGSLFKETNNQKKIEKNFPNLGDREIQVIKKHYKNTIVFKDKNATIKNLMNIESSKILHLSTHGIFKEDTTIINPMLKSFLVFAGGNKDFNKASLSALQLSTLNLKDTELVVLSACQSGLGDIQSAEGVVGLPKALLQAGAKNVIMSLWTVSNLKTALLMDYFYDNISKKQRYNRALQNAKIKMIQRHPYYWSSFILSGL